MVVYTNIQRKRTVLVSPLNWGLGHATRCIPIINQFKNAGYEVIIAASGASGILLKNEFPGCLQLSTPTANFWYSKYRWLFSLAVLLQMPKLNKLAQEEKEWLARVIRKHGVDLVVSDNRFGLSSPLVPCVYISHQLGLKTGFGKWADRLVQKKKYKVLDNFSEVWVPDYPGKHSIAGVLSQPNRLPRIPVHFIGPLSRLNKTAAENKKNHLLVMLSGPEPLRTILEEKINGQLRNYQGTVSFVRGLPGNTKAIDKHRHVSYHDHLSAPDLSEEISKAAYVICRSGYSSVMDLIKMEKRVIYIPTPGQTEQEYLARYLFTKGLGVWTSQNNFSLSKMLEQARQYNYLNPHFSFQEKFLYLADNLISGYISRQEKMQKMT